MAIIHSGGCLFTLAQTGHKEILIFKLNLNLKVKVNHFPKQ